MRVLHTISSMGIKSGGTTTCTYNLVKGLNALSIPTEVLSYNLVVGDNFPEKADFYKTVELKCTNKILYSRKYYNYLMNNPVYDLYHCNGLWQYPTHATAVYARKVAKPYIITLHGMLYPEALEKSKWIKKIYSSIWQNKDLENAAAIHVTCMEELKIVRNLGIKAPVAVIANAISTEDLDLPIIPQKGKIRIGFLGRLHPRKKVESLILALAKLPSNNNVELVVIGGGNDEYESQLKVLVQENKLSKQVVFCGFLEGKEKDDILNSLSYLAVPSDFENFGMIIAEALVRGIPVIASTGTPWKELNTYNCGWWVRNDVDSLINTFKSIIEVPEYERIAMGMRGKELIRNNYSLEIISAKMKHLYEYLLYGGEKPSFLYFN